ncbi:hypothetical protein BACT_1420 [Bifidobacterium actinocoloniiforme DSM 22766]|uniref:Uncharacterized protein n=1 Tax=Bifidobacterium actinocoloniiforme DSM 22766 TaxID=1437605 RepID=A0A086Z2G3_9BIFI|nr:hypothetical protein [Bifidobacterium actinocoloniiforme]KFI40713.1 hypothetical protein BACT_1420 [Bifidobacterium actinocoloniiforme DSM 22766]
MFIPVIFSFLVKRISPRAGFASLVMSAFTVAGTMAYGGMTHKADFALGGNWPIMFGIAIGLISYLLVTLLDKTRITPNAGGEGETAEAVHRAW